MASTPHGPTAQVLTATGSALTGQHGIGGRGCKTHNNQQESHRNYLNMPATSVVSFC